MRAAGKTRLAVILAMGRARDSSINEYIQRRFSAWRLKARQYRRTLRKQHGIVTIRANLFPGESDREVPVMLEKLRQQGYSHIVGLGQYMHRSFIDFAERWPAAERRLAILDGDAQRLEGTGIAALSFREGDLARPAGFLTARLAATVQPQEPVVAFLAGADVPATARWRQGFQDGLGAFNAWPQHEGNPVSFEASHVGRGPSGFSDEFGGYHAARFQHKWKRASVIVQAAGASAHGIARAVDEARREQRRACFLVCCDFDIWKYDAVAFSVYRPLERAIEKWVVTGTDDGCRVDLGTTVYYTEGKAWKDRTDRSVRRFARFDDLKKEWANAINALSS